MEKINTQLLLLDIVKHDAEISAFSCLAIPAR